MLPHRSGPDRRAPAALLVSVWFILRHWRTSCLDRTLVVADVTRSFVRAGRDGSTAIAAFRFSGRGSGPSAISIERRTDAASISKRAAPAYEFLANGRADAGRLWIVSPYREKWCRRPATRPRWPSHRGIIPIVDGGHGLPPARALSVFSSARPAKSDEDPVLPIPDWTLLRKRSASGRRDATASRARSQTAKSGGCCRRASIRGRPDVGGRRQSAAFRWPWILSPPDERDVPARSMSARPLGSSTTARFSTWCADVIFARLLATCRSSGRASSRLAGRCPIPDRVARSPAVTGPA